jgi:hypothetical protein
MPVTITCIQCGKKKKTYPSWARYGRGKFCNKTCQGKWNSKHRAGKKSYGWKGNKAACRTKHICEICGKSFRGGPTRRMCSRVCYGKHLSGLYRTKHHVTYKHGRVAYQQEYWARFPEKKRAWLMAQEAIKVGRLVKGPCEFCGTRRRIVAHHDDYSKPLKVRWMCVRCHTFYHIKKAKSEGKTWPAREQSK